SILSFYMIAAPRKIKGYATSEGTVAYKERFKDLLAEGHFRARHRLWFPSIGIGTYLGDLDDATDDLYQGAITEALLSGVNLVDTAINYRAQRSERCIGQVLAELIGSGKLKREEIIVCTKGGFLQFDGEYPQNPKAYFDQTYIQNGILKPGDLVEGYHAMAPAYLDDQIERSLENLGLQTVDIYYLHNPEVQLARLERKTFLKRLSAAFECLELKVHENKIRMYGLATWNGFRVSETQKDFLSLEEMVGLAKAAVGPDHHFKVVELPFNLAMPEAWILPNQRYRGALVSFLGICEYFGITAVTSASLLQGRLAGELPEFFRKHFRDLKQSVQCALQFARSVPGVTTSLVGMRDKAHVTANLQVAKFPPMRESEIIMLFQKRTDSSGEKRNIGNDAQIFKREQSIGYPSV
ncbi:MAG: aldo/keto reductase, partial [Candidatus Omnitrophica bacterium]|nr:aldo/keto reductase [Candidatus Omnitrophota bacterium]